MGDVLGMADTLTHERSVSEKDDLCSAPVLEGSERHGHLSDNVEEEQSRETEYSSCSAWDSHWEGCVRAAGNVEEGQSKAAECLPFSTSLYKTEYSSWEGLQCSVPVMSQVGEPLSPFDHLRNDTDSECSDVDLDNDWVTNGGSDTDASIESLERQKQSKWLRPFFMALADVAKTEDGYESNFFYCPACRGSGLGETDLYKGLKPLIAHAKNYTKRRVKLHKQFAVILEDLTNYDKTMGAYSGKPIYRQRHSIGDQKLIDPLIVWPPMVLIRAAGVKLEMHQKRVRLETKHFLEVFKDFSPKRVRHAYDGEDNLGLISLLVFLDSPVGYMHAKNLVKSFKRSGKGRKQFEHVAIKVHSCCDEAMYAYMATEEDMMFFDTCDASKKKIVWSMKSYKEVIIQPLVEMCEAKLENSLLKSQLQQEEEHNRCLEKALVKLHRNLELTEEEAYNVQKIVSRS
ncbi:hypothetical protein GOP47_0019583 [Adiantum capillus-veneris]|uniref:XS domain-containing protein n=1 Tax=Adiantum capillus-veneris TaxID=13818 RepID=A0A9D4UBB5_ADICA|nr:hypothetical protein GOP47_0019583 [Adiantum capillus-veneris]